METSLLGDVRLKLLLYIHHNVVAFLLFIIAKCTIMGLAWTDKEKEIKKKSEWSQRSINRVEKIKEREGRKD